MKFEVIGNHKVMGADKGDIIEIHDDKLIETLTAGGHIKAYKGKKRARNENAHVQPLLVLDEQCLQFQSEKCTWS